MAPKAHETSCNEWHTIHFICFIIPFRPLRLHTGPRPLQSPTRRPHTSASTCSCTACKQAPLCQAVSLCWVYSSVMLIIYPGCYILITNIKESTLFMCYRARLNNHMTLQSPQAPLGPVFMGVKRTQGHKSHVKLLRVAIFLFSKCISGHLFDMVVSCRVCKWGILWFWIRSVFQHITSHLMVVIP